MQRVLCATKPASALRTSRRARTIAFAVDAPTNGAKPTIGFDDLVDVIKAVDTSDVVELELKGKTFAMTVRKLEALKAAEPVYVREPAVHMASAPALAPPPAMEAPPQAPAPSAAAAPAPAPAAPPAASGRGLEVVSPMSGTLYRSPAPGEGPFVKEGDKIVKGQTICIIEAMKLMNEIEAEMSGTLVRFVADNNKMISSGDVIAIIEP